MPKLQAHDCDGLRPSCRNCTRGGRDCERPARELRFVIHSTDPDGESRALSVPDQDPPLVQQTPTTELLERANELASCSCRESLSTPEVAQLFAHYINFLAPWYDLNDEKKTFGVIVPTRALNSPVLFKALIAFSASHWNKTSGGMQEFAPAFHAACVRELLETMNSIEPRHRGDYLAATCLLRSYEILDGDSRRYQKHLLGAYSFVINDYIDLGTRDLLQAGAWNYLREEITVALECRRPVRISNNFRFEGQKSLDDDMLANSVTYLLARVINFSFSSHGQPDRIATWNELSTDLKEWKACSPTSFDPYSTVSKPGNPFPSLWMLRPWHVAAQQYCSIIEMLLVLFNPLSSADPDLVLVRYHALRICGLAYTNDSISARVNVFGPIAFCGRYLVEEQHRTALGTVLIDFSKDTAWPVNCIIEDLKECWASM